MIIIIILGFFLVVWFFAICIGAVLGAVAGVAPSLGKLSGYNAWWEKMKRERSPENMAKKK